MPSKVRVYGKAQNRTALGIMHAYLVMYPQATVEDLRKAFPRADINPDSGVDEIFQHESEPHFKEWAQWYFEKDDYEHRHALDLLMMTQGWRRFNWRQMAVRGEWELTQPDEHTPIITGTLYDYHFSNFYNISRWCDKLYEISEMYQTDSLNNAFQVDYTQLVSNQDFMQNQSFKEEMFNFNVRPRYLGFEYDEFDDFFSFVFVYHVGCGVHDNTE